MKAKSIVSLCILAVCANAYTSTDFYVSADRQYGISEGADADHRFNDLQMAIDAADPEDTVYVKDGFECNSGTSTYDSTDCRIFINKKLTLQGESGDWKTGPIIRGKYADDYKEGNASTRQGSGAVSCVRGTDKTKVTLIGFRLLEGSTPGKDLMKKSGGGAYKVTLQNCLVSGCAGRDGGGVNGCDTTDCEITDCYGSNTGGGCSGGIHHNALVRGCSSGSHGGGCDDATMYDSVITNCVAAGYGGGARLGTHYDTTFVGCTVAGSNNGGGVYNTTLYRCKFINCNRAAAYHVKAYDCDFTDCPSYSYGSAFMFYGSANIASNCTFRHNGTPAVGSMNAGNGARMIDCIVEDNEGTALACNYNGAVYYVINSYISCTNPANYAVLMNSYQGTGKNLNSVNATNSTFVGAIRGGGDFHNCLFIDGESSVDSMFYCNEKLATYSGKTVPLNLYNCTAIGNASAFGAVVDGGYVNVFNSIVRGNVGKSGTADHFATAQNSCLEDTAVAETEMDCIREDPLFITDDGGLPHPSETSPCRASGNLDYVMTETDLAGNPRTSIKDGLMVVAMGACEFDPDLAGAEITCQPTARLAPASGTFTASCSGLGTENLTYYWDFNGDGTIDIVTVDPICSYSYPMPGSYMATLYASNAVKGVSATFPMVILEGYFVSAHDIHEVPGLPGGWGTYTTLDGYEHLAYTNIQQAIDAASARDIVWIDSDFVCDEGATELPVGGKDYPMSFRIVVDKPLTLRGKTGDWRTGPTIRGAYGAEYDGTPASRRGEGAIACIRGMSGDRSQVVVEGVRLVGGATKALRKNELCGACASYVTLKNCLAQGGAAYSGGCVGYSNTEGCQIEDGYAANLGGGTYGGYHTNSVVASCTGGTGGGCAGDTSVSSFKVVDCVITNCSVGGYGGGTYYGSFYGCTIVDSRAGSFGAAGYRSNYYGCEVRRCESGALTGGNAYDCLFVSNKISNSSSAYASAYYFYPDNGTASYIVSNCTFTGNASPAVASGSYLGPDNLLVDCTITNNLGNGLYVYHANSPAFVRVVNCRFGSTLSGKFAVLTDKYNQDRTNASGPEVVNSVIEGPVQGSGEYYNCLFKNISVAAQAPVYCTEELATGPADARRPLTLVNCTVASNAATRAAGGVGGGYVVAVNSIVRENVGKVGEVDNYLAASNSCVEAVAQIGDAYACTTESPRFDKKTPGREFVPRASALRGTAQVFPWMSDSADPRSRDLAGRARITDGAPDMGAFEMYPPVGLLLMVR